MALFDIFENYKPIGKEERSGYLLVGRHDETSRDRDSGPSSPGEREEVDIRLPYWTT